jgi:hypothetical protein
MLRGLLAAVAISSILGQIIRMEHEEDIVALSEVKWSLERGRERLSHVSGLCY